MSNLTVFEWRSWKGAPTEPPDAVVQAAINAAELAIGNDLARLMIVATGTPSARSYAPVPGLALRVHDCVSVTSITVDGVALATDDYQMEPVNDSWSGQVRPYLYVARVDGGDWTNDYGRAIVTVTADWGWTVLPYEYTEATKILASDILDQKDIRGGVAGFGEFGAVRVRGNPMVTMLLDSIGRTAASIGIG